MINRRTDDYRVIHSDIATPETRTRYINIDSRFKTNPDDPDSNFTVQLVDEIKSITKIRVASVEFPNIPYVISEHRGNNKIEIRDIDGLVMKCAAVPDGNYTADELIDIINEQLAPEYVVQLNTNTGRVRLFPTTPTATGVFLHLDPDKRFTARDADWGLGYYLGFRKRIYELATIAGVRSEGVLNITGFNYYILQVNGYDIVQSPIKYNTVIGAAKLIMDGEKFSVVFEDGRNLLSFVYEPHPPVNITRVSVRVVDPYGEDVYPLLEPISLTLEVTTIMQSQLFEKQRNRMFEKDLLT
jgi:hypothetical protein